MLMIFFVSILFCKFLLFVAIIAYQENLIPDISFSGLNSLIFYFKAPSLLLSAELVIVNLVLGIIRLSILNRNSKISKDSLNINSFKLMYEFFDDCTNKISIQFSDKVIVSKSKLWKNLLDTNVKKGEYDLISIGFSEEAKEMGTQTEVKIKECIDTFLDFRDSFSDITTSFQNSQMNT